MDLGRILGRRRSENRIRRRTISAGRPPVNQEKDIEAMIQQYTGQAKRVGSKLTKMSKRNFPILAVSPAERNAQGKALLKQTIKHGIGVTYRSIMGPNSASKTKSKKSVRRK